MDQVKEEVHRFVGEKPLNSRSSLLSDLPVGRGKE